MNLSDTFYIALCMTVLILGVVYWFWTQNQFIQRKLNMLENIVYEMNARLDTIPAHPGAGMRGGSGESPAYAPAPGSELGEDEDLLHEQLTEEHASETMGAAEAPAPAPFVAPDEDMGIHAESLDDLVAAPATTSDDLQPGGVGSGIPDVAKDETKASVLDSMTLKELRRLAEQKGLPANNAMRKPQLIEIIRNAAGNAPAISPFEVKEEMTVHLT